MCTSMFIGPSFKQVGWGRGRRALSRRHLACLRTCLNTRGYKLCTYFRGHRASLNTCPSTCRNKRPNTDLYGHVVYSWKDVACLNPCPATCLQMYRSTYVRTRCTCCPCPKSCANGSRKRVLKSCVCAQCTCLRACCTCRNTCPQACLKMYLEARVEKRVPKHASKHMFVRTLYKLERGSLSLRGLASVNSSPGRTIKYVHSNSYSFSRIPAARACLHVSQSGGSDEHPRD